MPTFSVIIPTYGRPRLLADAVDSVLAQTVDDFEIVIVDDASPKPVELPVHRQLRVVRADMNGGAAAARNLGVEMSCGDILAFLDDDDRWHPERLQFALSALKRAPIAVCWQSTAGRTLEGNVHDVILDATTPSLGATAIRRAEWRPLDTSYRTCEDLAWWLDITETTSVATTPLQGLYVRSHQGSRDGYGAQRRIDDSQRLLYDRREYFAKHHRAKAFRWKRIGLMQKTLGERAAARRSFVRALRAHPAPSDVYHLLSLLR